MISAPILAVLACLDVSWAPRAGSILFAEFALLVGYGWFVTLANGLDRIHGQAPDQLAVVRIADLMAKALDDDCDCDGRQ